MSSDQQVLFIKSKTFPKFLAKFLDFLRLLIMVSIIPQEILPEIGLTTGGVEEEYQQVSS